MKSAEKAQHPWIGNPIINGLSLLAYRDKISSAKFRKMLRESRLAHADPPREVACRHLARFCQVTQDEQPSLMGDGLHRRDGLSSLASNQHGLFIKNWNLLHKRILN